MSFSFAFWSSVSVFGNTTSNVTYRSPFLLLWYSGMPSPLNFLISLGLVIPCESVKIEISCQLCHTTIILLLGGHVFTLVPISTRWLSRCLIVFSKPTRDCSWNSNMRLEGEGELTTRLAGKTRENCWRPQVGFRSTKMFYIGSFRGQVQDEVVSLDQVYR